MAIGMRFFQLNIGCLSRNRFWGESSTIAYRKAVCSTSLIELDNGLFLLVDPGLPFDQMRDVLFSRRGVGIEKVSAIFLTHFHADHVVDIDKYRDSKVFASQEEISLNKDSLPIAGIEPLDSQFEGITPVVLPGHTMGIAGLSLVSDGMRVLIAGDIVMTKDFYDAEEGFHNTADVVAMKASIREVKRSFDLVVPGHDVQFPTNRQMGGKNLV